MVTHLASNLRDGGEEQFNSIDTPKWTLIAAIWALLYKANKHETQCHKSYLISQLRKVLYNFKDPYLYSSLEMGASRLSSTTSSSLRVPKDARLPMYIIDLKSINPKIIDFSASFFYPTYVIF